MLIKAVQMIAPVASDIEREAQNAVIRKFNSLPAPPESSPTFRGKYGITRLGADPSDGSVFYFKSNNKHEPDWWGVFDGSALVGLVRAKLFYRPRLAVNRATLAWRNPSVLTHTGKLLLNHLLPTYKAIISDEENTDTGRAMWTRFVESAFEERFNVYLFEQASPGTKMSDSLSPITSIDEYVKLSADIYGNTVAHKRIHSIISLEPLSLK